MRAVTAAATQAPATSSPPLADPTSQQLPIPTANENQPPGRPFQFDYSELAQDVAAEAQTAAARIRERLKLSIFDTGRDLIAIKDRIPHGAFGPWLRAEFGMTTRTAENCMMAARLEEKYETVSLLPPTMVYPSVPEEVVAEILSEVKPGAIPDSASVRHRIIDAKDAAKKAAVEATKKPDLVKKEKALAKRRREVESERQRRLKEEHESDDARRTAQARRVAEYLLSSIGAVGIGSLLPLMRGTDWHRVEKQFGWSYANVHPLTKAEVEAEFEKTGRTPALARWKSSS
jgi:hypothetical protein